MRLKAIFSEAMRNIGGGTARAFAMFVGVALVGTLLGGYEAMSVIALESDAVTRISAYADVSTVVGGEVDGTACDRLSTVGGDAGAARTGPSLSGAMRVGDQVTPLSTPGRDLSSYEVTPGMTGLLVAGDANLEADASGVWVSEDIAEDFGLATGGRLATDKGEIDIAGVFSWPNDGRDTRFAYALIVPVSASGQTFEECWAKQWPSGGGLDDLLLSTVVVSSGDTRSSVGVTQLNKGFDAHYDARSSYLTRMTRFTPWLALAVGVLLGVISVRRRRLEYAGALHSGQSKGAQLLGIACETLVWSGAGLACSCSLLVAYGIRASRSDPGAVIAASLRSPAALFAGTLIAALAVGLLIRESQLFRFFKRR